MDYQIIMCTFGPHIASLNAIEYEKNHHVGRMHAGHLPLLRAMGHQSLNRRKKILLFLRSIRFHSYNVCPPINSRKMEVGGMASISEGCSGTT